MRVSTVFIFLMAFMVIMTIFETVHDHEVIENMVTGSEAWKIWGNIGDMGYIIMISALVAWVYESWYMFIFWIPIFWMTHWITHDVFVGYWMTGDLLYIGVGKFDQYMGAIFQQSGLLYVGVRMFILSLMIGTYFRLDPEENYE